MGLQGTFGCNDGIAYQVAVPTGQIVSTLYSYNVITGVRTQVGNPAPSNINSLIYSTAANGNILWGTVVGESSLIRIGGGSGTVRFNIPELATTNMSFNVGVELPNAYMLINSSGESKYYVIDVDPSRATYLEMVDPTNNYALKTGPDYGIPLSAPIGGSDIAYMASTGLAYSINNNRTIVTLNPVTGALVTYPTSVSGLPEGGYGGMFSDKADKLYAFHNLTGGFYKIDPVTNTAALISTSTPSGGTDAASCPEAVVECDTDIPIEPADPTICIGTTTKFTVQPDGNGPFTYHWQQSSNGGTTWTNMLASGSGVNGSFSGGNTNELTITPATMVWNGFKYRCNITSNLCTAPSSAATLNIYAIPGAPTLLAATDAPICPATTYDLNRLISGTAPAGSTLRFYTSSSPSPETLVSDPTVASSGTYYARYENLGCGGPVSQPITILGCQTAFGCENGMGYQVSAADAELVSSLYAFNINTGVRTLISPLSMTVNALVFNSADNMLWAAKNNSSSIVRINAQGGLIEFVVPNLPVAYYNVGVQLPDGYMLVYVGGSDAYFVIDIDQRRATYLRLVDPTNGFALKTGPNYGTALNPAVNLSDLAFLPATQLCYGIDNTGGRLATLNPFTGQVTVGAVVQGITISPFGAFFADAAGKLYGFHNTSGAFYKIDPVTAIATPISTAIPSSSNDGASCAAAVICDVDLTQPEPGNQTTCTGSATTFTVTATTIGSATLIYQWQVSTNGGNTWTDLLMAGATNANGSYAGAGTNVLTVTPATGAWNGNQYRVEVTSDSELCTLTSSAGSLSVTVTPIKPELHTTSASPICPPETVDLLTLVSSSAPEGSTLQFYTSSTPSEATLVADPTQVGAGTYYTFYANASCKSPASDAIVVEVDCDLPVTLVSFAVTKEGENTAILNWATTEETNSDRFEVERSSDARTWVKIGEIASFGESSTLKKYNFTDQDTPEGITYYRLKMVDKDASYAYSRIQTTEFSATVTAYPNPTSGSLKLKNFIKVKHVVLHNAAGRKVLERSGPTAEGVDISHLTPGVYNVTLSLFDGSKQVQKIVVSH
jgi:hypothetical protein